jgi:hypothetical protein
MLTYTDACVTYAWLAELEVLRESVITYYADVC